MVSAVKFKNAAAAPRDGLIAAWFDELPDLAMQLEVERWFKRALREVELTAEGEAWLAGVIVHWFKNPPRERKRPKATVQQLVRKQMLVAGCVCLIDVGLTAKTAADTVADAARKLTIRRPGDKEITGSTVYDWWRQFRSTAGCRLLAASISRDQPGLSSARIIEAMSAMLLARADAENTTRF